MICVSPDKATTANVRAYMVRELQNEPAAYIDCGEVNSTKLGENATWHFAIYGTDETSTPEWIWDLAHDVASAHEDDDITDEGR